MRSHIFTGVGFVVAVVFLFHACGGPESNQKKEDPNVPYPGFSGQDFRGEKNFAYLINHFREAVPARIPWAGFWWPYTGNGIASGTYGRGLSPAGKYDAARGGKTRAQVWEAKHHGTGDPKVQGWWGHCNGWSAAAALFSEPKTSVKVNGITFGIGDIKALLTEAAMEVNADFFGDRVDWGSDYSGQKFLDVVPDQFFLVLTNYIGKFKQAVLIDRYTGDQVWNQPVAGYRFEYPKREDYIGADSQAPNVHRILVTATIWWVRDDVLPDTTTPSFQFEDNGFFTSRTLKMELWLDGPVIFNAQGRIESSGNLIVTRQGDFHYGGSWKNGNQLYNDAHPDYMWVPYSVLKPTEYANKEIDFSWIEKHILSGGVDDPTASPTPIVPAPPASPRPEHSSWPRPNPSTWPSSLPWPWPEPTVRPSLTPQPLPSRNPHPIPRPST